MSIRSLSLQWKDQSNRNWAREKGFTVVEAVGAVFLITLATALALSVYTSMQSADYKTRVREAVFSLIENDMEKIGVQAIKADRRVVSDQIVYDVSAMKCQAYGAAIGVTSGIVISDSSHAKILRAGNIKVERVVRATAPQLSQGGFSNRPLTTIDYHVTGLPMGLVSSVTERNSTKQHVATYSVMPEGYSRC